MAGPPDWVGQTVNASPGVSPRGFARLDLYLRALSRSRLSSFFLDLLGREHGHVHGRPVRAVLGSLSGPWGSERQRVGSTGRGRWLTARASPGDRRHVSSKRRSAQLALAATAATRTGSVGGTTRPRRRGEAVNVAMGRKADLPCTTGSNLASSCGSRTYPESSPTPAGSKMVT